MRESEEQVMKTGAGLLRPRAGQSSARHSPPSDSAQSTRIATPDVPHRPMSVPHVQVVPPIPGFSPRSEDAVARLLRDVAPERLVLGASLLTGIIYLGFVLAFPITRWWNHPHTADGTNAINDMGRITGYSPIAAVLFVVTIVLLFACQFLALTATMRITQVGPANGRRDLLARRIVLFAPLVFAAIMIWMQPVTTTDLYGYVARGYLFVHLHLNPMTHGAQLLPGGLRVDRPASPYGPAWLLVTALVSRVAGDNLLENMLAFKVIGFGFMALGVWLVDLLARTLYPARRLRIVVLFAWSPLLLFEAIGNGHNDIVMMVCVLAAFALMLRGWVRTAFALLVVGALVKYVSAILIPLWLIYELRALIPHPVLSVASMPSADAPNSATDEALATPGPSVVAQVARARVLGWMRSAASTARQVDRRALFWLLAQVTVIGLVLAVVCYAPFWDGLQTFTGLGQQIRPNYYNSSIVGFFSAPLQVLVSATQYKALDKTIRLVVYVIFAIYAYLQAQRLWSLGTAATLRDVITAAAKITFAVLLLITFWFQPWYVVWLLPLAALAQDPLVRRQGTILAAGALLTYAVGNFLFVNEDTDLARGLFVQFFEILVAFAPLLFLRAAPFGEGWTSSARRFLDQFSEGLSRRAVFWERVMLALTAIVAALLRLVRLGNLFDPVSTTNSATSSAANILKQTSSDLKLFLSDPQGLNGPFVAVQGLLVQLFGPTVLAVLLPSAVLGSLTVVAIYMLTYVVMRQGNLPGRGTVALLAALLAATSRWHVSLSRSGMQVVLLPLLLCTAVLLLLLALRMPATTSSVAPVSSGHTGGRSRKSRAARRSESSAALARDALGVTESRSAARQRLLLYIGGGICTGLACDLAPGLWLVPLLVAGILLIWRWRLPEGLMVSRRGVTALVVASLVSGAPVVWHYLNTLIGFPPGSTFLARTSVPITTTLPPLSTPFWVQAERNAGDMLRLLTSQDYSVGFPASGGTPIIPALLGPFFFLGLLLIIIRWRSFGSLALLLLVILPLVASIAVGTPTGVIEAASVLPALCIVPALGIYQTGRWLSHLPIVLDRINGVRVFSTPEQIGRVLLLVFLVVSTIRTFFWYFEVTLPSRPKEFSPTYNGPRVVAVWTPIVPTTEPSVAHVSVAHPAAGV